jgi:ferric-dicitrate binding protein FerR (iron transport regulator)
MIGAGIVCAALVSVFIARRAPHHAAFQDTLASQRYATRSGQRARIVLSRDVHVTLAPQSTLTVNGATITLSGEALFSVVHREEAPIVVKTGDITTRVLGTTFTVRHYPGEPMTRVAVLEGRVATGGVRMTAVAAHTVALVTDSSVTTASSDQFSSATEWTKGRLVFRDAPARDVLATIERWYGITFRTTDPTLDTRVLTTTLDVERSQSDVLALVAALLDVRMSASHDTITLSPRQTSARTPSVRRSPIPLVPSFKDIGR